MAARKAPMKKYSHLLLLIAALWQIGAQAASFKDCADCPEMETLPTGSFQMGAAMPSNAAPVHVVTLRAFAIGKYEVTQGEWKAVMGSNPSKAVTCGDTCPVESVSWHDAQEFVKRLSAKTGKAYRLPSEAEWEYACRAGGRHDYCGGDDADRVAWAGDTYGSPHPAGQKQPNIWGLYDMSGNVWEWTQDCSHASYAGAPADGSSWEDAGECASRILRGGSWLSGPQYSRATLRFSFKPSFRTGDFGFRVVRVLE